MSIARELDGKLVDEVTPKGEVIYDPKTLIYTFEDSSTAIMITMYKDCKPYQTASLSTLSKKPYRIWMMK